MRTAKLARHLAGLRPHLPSDADLTIRLIIKMPDDGVVMVSVVIARLNGIRPQKYAVALGHHVIILNARKGNHRAIVASTYDGHSDSRPCKEAHNK